MANYGIFRTNDAKRIAAATRRVEGMPRNYLRVPQQIANRWGQPPADAEDDGFPPGTDGCDCGHCFQGVTIPDASGPEKCCTSHLQWPLVNPWLACEDTDLTLEYAGDADGWLSEPFDGPDCDGNQNEYRWQLTIDVTGRSYLTLVLETDNGCDPVCIIYGRDSFDCQCDNEFVLRKPYGTHIGVDRDDLSCKACLKPVTRLSDCTTCLIPETVFVEVEGFTDADNPSGDCTQIDGVYELHFDTSGVNTDCTWLGGKSVDDLCATLSSDQVGVAFHLDHARNYSVAIQFPGESYHYIADQGCPTSPQTLTFSHRVRQNIVNCPIDESIQICNYPAEVTLKFAGATSIPTSAGVCDETCDPTPAPVDPDAGACCFEGVLYDYWPESLCADFGGEWCPDADDCDCEAEVACCLISGDCIIIDAFACNFLAGTPSGDSCDPNPCGGACCESDGSCTFKNQSDCEGGGGFYHGDGTDCGDYDCNMTACCSGPPIPPGNCACTDQTWAGCSGGTEVALGRGTTCADPEGYTCTNYPSVDCGWDPP